MTSNKCSVLLWLLCLHFIGNECGLNQKRLLKDLFDQSKKDAYNVLERPSKNDIDTVNVDVSVHLIQLKVAKEKNQIEVTTWISMSWRDYQLQWDPEKYGNITYINIAPDRVWKPDIYLYNSAAKNFAVTSDVNVVIRHNSEILWVVPIIIKSNCNMDYRWFPFDSQKCSFTLGSWTYSVDKVNLTLPCLNKGSIKKFWCDISLDYFKDNNQYKITLATLSRSVAVYKAFPNEYIELTVTIGVKRKYLYYRYSLIVPCVIVSLMVFLMLWLPPNSTYKISLGVTVILSMTLLLLLVFDKIPPSSMSIPLISQYIISVIILSLVSLIFSIIILNIYQRSSEDQSVPTWMKVFVNKWLAKAVFMKNQIKVEGTRTDTFRDGNRSTPLVNVKAEGELLSLIKDKEIIEKNMLSSAQEWIFAAKVIDRCCLIVFGITLILIIIVVLARFSNKLD